MKLSQAFFFLALLASVTDSAQAQAQNPGQPALQAASAADHKALAKAEVLKVYRKEKRLLLQHGPIPNLGMSAMTMEFGVRNAGMLKSLKSGDRVRFTAEQVKDDYVVTFIEVTK